MWGRKRFLFIYLGNKDTMTTMVVVIVDDGDHHLDHDETLGGGPDSPTTIR